MHEFEDVLVLRIDPQSQRISEISQPVAELVEGNRRVADVSHHDHREELLQRRLRDVDDIRIRICKRRRDSRDDADAIDADDGYDDSTGLALYFRVFGHGHRAGKREG